MLFDATLGNAPGNNVRKRAHCAALPRNGGQAHLLVRSTRFVVVANTHLLVASELHCRTHRQPLFQREISRFSYLKSRDGSNISQLSKQLMVVLFLRCGRCMVVRIFPCSSRCETCLEPCHFQVSKRWILCCPCSLPDDVWCTGANARGRALPLPLPHDKLTSKV